MLPSSYSNIHVSGWIIQLTHKPAERNARTLSRIVNHPICLCLTGRLIRGSLSGTLAGFLYKNTIFFKRPEWMFKLWTHPWLYCLISFLLFCLSSLGLGGFSLPPRFTLNNFYVLHLNSCMWRFSINKLQQAHQFLIPANKREHRQRRRVLADQQSGVLIVLFVCFF